MADAVTTGGRTILLTFSTVSWQKGSAAQVESLVGELRRLRGDLRFQLLSHRPELDREPARDLGIEVVDPGFPPGSSRNRRSAALMARRLMAAASAKRRRRGSIRRRPGEVERMLEAYASADLVVDLSGDSYRDPPGGFALAHHANFLLALACETPYVLASQSLGPFARVNRPLARFCLRRARLLYVRERRTTEILERLGVPADAVHLAPDVAFSLPAAPAEAVLSAESIDPSRLPRPWFAVSVSHLAARLAATRRGNAYLDEMALVTEHLHRRYGATVLLVPHEIAPAAYGPDDRATADTLYARAGSPPWMHRVRGDHGPSSLKGLIAACDALIASRMHAGIAGLSSGVPTVLVGWSHKYQGVMDGIGLADCVWDQRDAAPSSLVPLVDRVWRRRDELRRRLLAHGAAAREQVAGAIERVAECLPRSGTASGAAIAGRPVRAAGATR